ncbi:MAG: hypothetical protein ACI4KF_00915 [Huintestinicola sp.]
MDIAFVSENKIMQMKNGIISEIPCGKIIKYKETLDSIRRRSEWKNTGKGAQFMGTATTQMWDSDEVPAKISGISLTDIDADGEISDRLVYGVILDDSGSLYHRSLDRSDSAEGLILSGNDTFFGAFDCYKGKMAVSMGSSTSHLHIAVMEPPSSHYTEYTDGDTIEENPYISRCRNGIYFSTAGYGRDESGAAAGISPRAAAFLDLDTNEMSEILSDEKTDYYKIKDDSRGNIYYIRQPYGGERPDSGIKFTDILFFPFRLFKGLFGWLNFMCTIWGGESLKNGGGAPPAFGGEKSRQRSRKDMIIEGNVINAERLANAEKLKDDDLSGFMPLSRVLVKRSQDGSEEILAKGVLDYTLTEEGILISDGRQILLLSEDGSRRRITKASFAQSITVID